MRWLLTVIGLFCALLSVGANRYASPNGSDSNPCTQSRPCRSVQRGIGVMQDGDTLILADGVYSTNLADAYGCGHDHTSIAFVRNKDCPNGCTIRAENIDAENPRVTFRGGESGVYITRSDGWTVEGIFFEAPAGVHLCFGDSLALRDSIVEFQQEPARTYYGLRIMDSTNVEIADVHVSEKDKPCFVRKTGSDSSGHYGIAVQNTDGLLIEDSYFGFTTHLGSLSNCRNVTFSRTRFQHWGEHGMTIANGTGDVVFENVIWGGRSPGHCWNGSSQSSLTTTACYSDTECAAEPGGANVCRIDDCFCTYLRDSDPPYCGTCDANPGDPNDTCWRGTRTLDLYEVDGLVVRNNSFVGHGYMPISAMYRNFTQHNANANCSTYPGVCEFDTSVTCTEAQEDAFCQGRGLGRCIPICEVKDYKFYNNLIYDLANLDLMKDASYLRVPTESVWNQHSNMRIDGNLYSGGQKSWWGCEGEPHEQVMAARFGPDDQGRCWDGTLSSYTGESCTTNGQCSTGLCNNRQWQGSLCYGQPVDLSGHWFADIESSFADYRRESYEPASASAVMVDAGIDGTDPDGVRRCSVDDFNGNPRTDGNCDIGAFELGESGPPDDPVDDPPPAVENLDRTDKVD